MARSDTDTSRLEIPPSDRVTGANATGWHQPENHGQNQGQERRYQNPNRISIFDLLFEEVDAIPEIDEPVQRRLKRHVRRNFRQQMEAPPTSVSPVALPSPSLEVLPAHPPSLKSSPIRPPTKSRAPPSPADDLVKVVIPTIKATDTEHLIQTVARSDSKFPDDPVVEARRIADQLRYCLGQHTETAQKVSVYLRALLVLTHGHYKPTMVIEI